MEIYEIGNCSYLERGYLQVKRGKSKSHTLHFIRSNKVTYEQRRDYLLYHIAKFIECTQYHLHQFQSWPTSTSFLFRSHETSPLNKAAYLFVAFNFSNFFRIFCIFLLFWKSFFLRSFPPLDPAPVIFAAFAIPQLRH